MHLGTKIGIWTGLYFVLIFGGTESRGNKEAIAKAKHFWNKNKDFGH